MHHLRNLILFVFLLCGLDSFSQLNHKHFILMGRIDLSEENYSDAMYNFNKAIIAKPNDFEGYFLRGITKYSLNDYIGAIEQCSASCKSLNFNDSPVMQEFMRRMYGISDYQDNINTRCIELPDGTVVTPVDAINWLKAQEVQADE